MSRLLRCEKTGKPCRNQTEETCQECANALLRRAKLGPGAKTPTNIRYWPPPPELASLNSEEGLAFAPSPEELLIESELSVPEVSLEQRFSPFSYAVAKV